MGKDNELYDLIKNEEKLESLVRNAEIRAKNMLSNAEDISEKEIWKYEKIWENNINKKSFCTKEYQDNINNKTKEEINNIFSNYDKNESQVTELFIKNIVNVNLKFPKNWKENFDI